MGKVNLKRSHSTLLESLEKLTPSRLKKALEETETAASFNAYCANPKNTQAFATWINSLSDEALSVIFDIEQPLDLSQTDLNVWLETLTPEKTEQLFLYFYYIDERYLPKKLQEEGYFQLPRLNLDKSDYSPAVYASMFAFRLKKLESKDAFYKLILGLTTTERRNLKPQIDAFIANPTLPVIAEENASEYEEKFKELKQRYNRMGFIDFLSFLEAPSFHLLKRLAPEAQSLLKPALLEHLAHEFLYLPIPKWDTNLFIQDLKKDLPTEWFFDAVIACIQKRFEQFALEASIEHGKKSGKVKKAQQFLNTFQTHSLECLTAMQLEPENSKKIFLAFIDEVKKLTKRSHRTLRAWPSLCQMIAVILRTLLSLGLYIWKKLNDAPPEARGYWAPLFFPQPEVDNPVSATNLALKAIEAAVGDETGMQRKQTALDSKFHINPLKL